MRLFGLSFVILSTAIVSGGISAGAVWFYLREQPVHESFTATPPVVDFSLLDHRGRYHRLYHYKDALAVVLYAYDAACSKDENLTKMAALKDIFAVQGVEFFIINANRQKDRVKLQEEASRLQLDIPILSDDSQLAFEELGIERSGDALVLTPGTWQVRYRGPLQENRTDRQPSSKPPRNYLRDAIEAVVARRPVEIPVARGDGCFIEFDREMGRRDISYAKEIVPILKEKCVTCHRAKGIGPWAMDGYETVKAWSASMYEAILVNEMPPWPADPAIGSFAKDRSLLAADKRKLIRWIKAGAPRGEGEDPLTQIGATWNDEWPLGIPDRVIDVPKQKIPATGLVPYRWIKIPVTLASDKWVRAVHLKPGDTALMHHGFVFIEYPDRIKKSEPPWLEGLNGFFAAHVPGINTIPFPENSGQLLPKGSTLVFQLHYLSSGEPAVDQPKLALYFHDRPPAVEYKMSSVSNMAIRIPPYAADHEEIAETILKEDALLHVFYPHLHYRGKRFRYEAIYADGSSEILLSVPHYDIDWQYFYRLASPKMLPAGTRIKVKAGFDNSENNPDNPDPSQEVRWGLKSRDEMLVGYFMYTRERKGEAKDALATAKGID